MEVLPGSCVGTKTECIPILEFSRSRLVRIDTGSILAACLECRNARVVRPPLGDQLVHTTNVLRAPAAPGLSRTEPNRVGPIVDPLAYAIDPSNAQRLVD